MENLAKEIDRLDRETERALEGRDPDAMNKAFQVLTEGVDAFWKWAGHRARN